MLSLKKKNQVLPAQPKTFCLSSPLLLGAKDVCVHGCNWGLLAIEGDVFCMKAILAASTF